MHGVDDTIVAVSSPPGRSLRGLIRISGPNAWPVTQGLVTAGLWRSRCMVTCRLWNDRLAGLLLPLRGPGTYTGQDTVELQLPGHPLVLHRVMESLIEAGARLAEPGEFTFRAVLAGKLDLTQAEGVAATITAISDAQLRAADTLRQGRLGQWSMSLVDRIAEALALVEAGIDFTDEEDARAIGPGELARRVGEWTDEIEQCLKSHQRWSALERLPRVVLAGPPSSGKSSLFNALLGRARAVTSATPGTTRDVLVEPWQMGGEREVLLVDMAGLDDPLTGLDQQVQAAARRALMEADLVLWLDDGRAVAPPALHAPVLVIQTKADRRAVPAGSLAVSSHLRQGLDELADAVRHRLACVTATLSGERMVLQPRHEETMQRTIRHLRAVANLLAPAPVEHLGPPDELLADQLRQALGAMGEMGGAMTPDDVLGRVFATFCIGK